MNEKEIRKKLKGRAFCENNGLIMRYVNILDPKECTLKNIRFLMQDEAVEAIQNSLNYLQKAWYITITGPKGEAFSGQLDDDNEDYKVSLTAEGLEVLMGIKNNPSIDI